MFAGKYLLTQIGANPSFSIFSYGEESFVCQRGHGTMPLNMPLSKKVKFTLLLSGVFRGIVPYHVYHVYHVYQPQTRK